MKIASYATGICFPGSTIDQIPDGTSYTILFGEKYLDSDRYADGTDNGDNESVFIGDNADIARWTYITPYRDAPGLSSVEIFGSAHAATFNAVLCDGSVRAIDYSVDATSFLNLGNRKDHAALKGLW
jgi:hypothetical protein